MATTYVIQQVISRTHLHLERRVAGPAWELLAQGAAKQLDKDPDDLFEKTSSFFEEVREMMESENLSQARKTAYEEHSIDTMATMIFGSNMIEKAGSTERLCKDVFTGVTVASEILDITKPSIAAVWKSPNTPQHGPTSSPPSSPSLTSSHLLTTHLILCADLPLDDHTPYAGLYRLVSVHAGLTPSPPYTGVPSLIRTLVHDYNVAIDFAKSAGFLYPFALAEVCASVCEYPSICGWEWEGV
ncbi:hypothetical protein VC83_02383 [Pseudogymnoascus destructans]|uniref:Uncharacterized protein n=2 Tax=Pseudogymnoascus destructans TaxID=655981 RepID=L8G0C9_PSED2|nr:uncharacterized protein VC83_02383 [Pseudogymnoascus destructans]ELR06224.1 hypothetical protein GMDG_07879 [Pseudogymnoascus destructans 20631-21]OAF60865.1 hypothetical protein VC83_02383 [Pseudogymnoascus destructans]